MDQTAKVYSFIRQHQLISAGDTVILAVSGGVDSMVMSHILLSLQVRLGFSPIIAIFDHQIRPESAEEVRFVQAFGDSEHVRVVAGSGNIPALSQGRNIEDVARRERYRFLRQVAVQHKAAAIATAHHQGDQAETVLMHLLHGSGCTGLSGIAPKCDDLIRPLLCLTRKEILEYAQDNHLEFREDNSNFDTRYLRNRIRLNLLPELKKYNNNVILSLNQTAELCREENLFMEELAETALAELWQDDAVSLSGSGLKQLPRALQRRVVRKAYRLTAGQEKELSFAQVESVLALKEEQRVDLPGGYLVYRRGDFYFAKAQPPLQTFSEVFPLLTDGRWHSLGNWGWEYLAAENGTGDGFRIPMTFSNLFFRTRRDGDVIFSQGKKGSKKLKELFIEKKIPPFLRNSWPLLLAENEILWAPELWQRNDICVEGKRYLLIKIRLCDKI